MKKKLAFTAALLALTMSLAACGDETPPPLTTPAESEPTHLTEETTSSAETTPLSGETTTTPAETTSQEPVETLITTEKPVDIEPQETTDNTVEAVTSAPAEEVTEAWGGAPQGYCQFGENYILTIEHKGHYMALMGCWGTYDNCDRYIAAVNRAAEKLPDVNVYNMVVPTSSEFYTPSTVTGFTSSQRGKIDYINENLKNVTVVDAYSQLEKNTDKDIFARTDHHWLPLGAYYGAKAFAEAADFAFPDISKYKAVSRDDYVGSMYHYGKDEHIRNDPEVFTLFISPNDADLRTTYYNTSFANGYESALFVSRNASSFYCSFLGSDDRIAKIETGVDNGRVLVISKESYGNGIVPFLTSGFETIYVTDCRYFDLNLIRFCKDVGATDLLFSVCTFTPAGGNVSYIEYVTK